MPVTFQPAPAVERTAEKLIRNHHTNLTDVEIRYVFRSDTANKNGKPVMGTARKVTGLNAYLAQPAGDPDAEDFFVIEISEPSWTVLDAKQREALVDHELCHCTTIYDEDTDTVKLAIRAHDLEEFRVIVERHGLWQPDLEAFARTVVQGEFTFDAAGDRQ